MSAKDHERERRAIGVCAGTYNLTLTSPLPNREVIMKSKANKMQPPRRKLSRTVLCSWRGDGYARRLAEKESNVLCRIVRPAKVHLFECRQIHDLHKEERQTTTCEVASSDGQKSAPSHAQRTPSNDTLEGSRQAGCPSNYHH